MYIITTVASPDATTRHMIMRALSSPLLHRLDPRARRCTTACAEKPWGRSPLALHQLKASVGSSRGRISMRSTQHLKSSFHSPPAHYCHSRCVVSHTPEHCTVSLLVVAPFRIAWFLVCLYSLLATAAVAIPTCAFSLLLSKPQTLTAAIKKDSAAQHHTRRALRPRIAIVTHVAVHLSSTWIRWHALTEHFKVCS
jgi:hypothetical protein